MTAAHYDRSAPGDIGAARARLAEDQRTGGEIGAGDDGDKIIVGHDLAADDFAVDMGKTGIDDLAEIMRRNVGRHADRDTARAVDQEVGKARGQNLRFRPAGVVIGREIDGVLVEILEQRHRRLGQPGLGVAHRCRKIGVHRPEIALAVHEDDAHRPVLREAGQRHVDRTVAVRMVVAHDVADDLGALAIRPAGDEAALLAGIEDAAMDRLQPVAHVGQRAADDHAHRVIEITRLHLFDDTDRLDVRQLACRLIVFAQNAPFSVLFCIARR